MAARDAAVRGRPSGACRAASLRAPSRDPRHGSVLRRRGGCRLRPRRRGGRRRRSVSPCRSTDDEGDRPMTDTTYVLYPVFMASEDFREAFSDPDDRARAAQEVKNLIKSWDGRIEVRGSYSTVGFRADADLMLWLIGATPSALQRALVEFRRTEAGRLLDMTWTFMGVVRPAEFTPDHAPAFVKGEAPKSFLCVYPFVRTPEWYLLASDERAELLRDHGT